MNSIIVIPRGWRELKEGDIISEDDMYYEFGNPEKLSVCGSGDSVGEIYKRPRFHLHIRKDLSQISQYTFE
jgi:hypothetical protein